MTRKQHTETFFSTADKVGTFLFANFICLVVSLTIIGIPFATAGLFATMARWVQGQQPDFFKIFGGVISQQWRKILVIGLLDVAVGGLLFINYSIFQMMQIDNLMAVLSGIMTLCVTVILVMVNIYVWSYLSQLDLSIRNLLKLSFILGLTYPFTSIAITIAVLIPIVISLFLPIAFFFFVTFSSSAFIGAKGAWFVLNRHYSQDEINQLMGNLI